MKNHVAVSTVREIEAGDQIAFDIAGVTASGRVTAVPDRLYNLTNEQVEYLTSRHIRLPESWAAPMGTDKRRLVFGKFYSPGVVYEHVFLDYDKFVAVFPTN